jgi:hypothetical protein
MGVSVVAACWNGRRGGIRTRARYRQSRTPRRMTALRGERSSSTQTRRGTHRGERATTPPDQNVTGRPSALLDEPWPRLHAMNVTTRCVSRRCVSPCGSGPYASPAPRCAAERVLWNPSRAAAAARREAAAHPKASATGANGRPAALAPEVADRIRTERAAGKSLAAIARELNATETPTVHGGAQWWPSTVRAILGRTHP